MCIVIRSYFNQIDFAKESGLREGKEQGLKEGKEQGLKEGKEQGEKNKQLEIAASMKADGMPIATIQKYTGLSAEAILKI